MVIGRMPVVEAREVNTIQLIGKVLRQIFFFFDLSYFWFARFIRPIGYENASSCKQGWMLLANAIETCPRR
jgi:hypothetical protein